MKETKALRIKKFADHKNISLRSIELKVGSALGVISSAVKRNGETKLDISKFLEEYPEVNPKWIYEGKGEMLINTDGENLETKQTSNKFKNQQETKIPIFDMGSTASNIESYNDMINEPPAFYITMPDYKDCDFGTKIYGDSMSPEIKSGDYIICKKILVSPDTIIQLGEKFLIVTKDNQRMVKVLKKGSLTETILCVSTNSEFEPFEIKKESIHSLFLIKGVIKRTTT